MIAGIESKIMSAVKAAIPDIARAASLPDPDLALTGVPPQGDVVIAMASLDMGEFNAINMRRAPAYPVWIIRLRLRDMRPADQVTAGAYGKLEAVLQNVHGLEIDPSTYVYLREVKLSGYGDGIYVYDVKCSCTVMMFN